MRAAEWLRSRRFPARAPIVVLDPYGFRRALRELGWEPARLVVAERFVPRLRGLTGFRRWMLAHRPRRQRRTRRHARYRVGTCGLSRWGFRGAARSTPAL